MLKDPTYNLAVDRLWQDVVSKRVYLTGGLGSVGGTEAFGDDYALPNRTAYTETCASVGGILWYHRMFLKSGDAKYLDAFEQTLYNGLLSGVSVKGDTFFYQNPLESTGRNERSAYFDVACCPANLARLVAQLPGLIYATDGQSSLRQSLRQQRSRRDRQGRARCTSARRRTIPWDGNVQFEVSADRAVEFTLKLRVPGWLGRDRCSRAISYHFTTPTSDSRVRLRALDDGRVTRPGWYSRGTIRSRRAATRQIACPRVIVDCPMPVRRVVANPGVKDDVGKAAIQRGPIVYALEAVDNGGKVLDVPVPMNTTFTPAFKPDLLGGVTVLTATLPATADAPARTITAVPYFAWANRGRGEMVVWIKQ